MISSRPAPPDTHLHHAYVATQLAAIAVISPHLERAARKETAAFLSTLLLLRAEALDLTGRPAEARTVRLDSLGWARYGFGPDWAVRAKLREVSALSPLKKVASNPSIRQDPKQGGWRIR